MLDVLLLFSSICTAVVVGASQTITGYRGQRVEIRCSYESGYETYSKYFCKGECNYGGNKNIIVKSGSPDKDERFSLTDDTTARVFTVTITDLRTEDAGKYWCAVERSLPLTDKYSEIMLLVKHDNKTTEVSTISTFSKTPSSFSTTELNPQSGQFINLASVAGGLGSVLLVLTLCSGTFIILKKRKRKSGTALFQQNVQHNTETDRMYEEIPNTDVAAVTQSNQAPSSSSNQTPASHLNNCKEVSTVYTTVTNQQPDSNHSHTHSTNQVTDTAGDYYGNIKFPEATQDSGTELIYVTATHPQNITTHPHNVTTNEGPIYSVINHMSSSLSVDITVRGTEGGRVNITCPYPERYKEYYKYFYKGPFKKKVLILQSDGKKTVYIRDRFSLKDNHKNRSFKVTISILKMEDAGPYGCGAGAEHYQHIQLNVTRAPETTTSVQISTSSISPYTNSSTEHTSTAPETTTRVQISTSSVSPYTNSSTEHTSTVTHQTETETTRTTTGNTTVQLYQPNIPVRSDLASVAGGLGSVLLVLTLCCGSFIIWKKRKSGTALFQQNVQHNTETYHVYEEIQNTDVAMANTSSSNPMPVSSSNQTPASHLNTCPKVSTVYTTVTNQQPDSNPSHIHSTNQMTDATGDYYASVKSPEATQDSGTELIYVTATHPQNSTTNQGPIYSVINDK
ncbi:uncharacterized protein LOC143710511 [Siphateles boraxobius]|uniref:uncharacterized protein LOC143710511 n=1 Tax=Siphateles boraxobius TaxID=180520 RepID=UPI004064B715